MANKALNTRQKQVFQLPRQQPRDTTAQALRGKRGGVQGKQGGAKRAVLQRLLKLGEDQ